MDFISSQLMKNNYTNIIKSQNTLSFTFKNSSDYPEITANFKFQDNLLKHRSFQLSTRRNRNLLYLFSDFSSITDGEVKFLSDTSVQLILHQEFSITSELKALEILKESVDTINDYLNNQSSDPINSEECFYTKASDFLSNQENSLHPEAPISDFHLIFNLNCSKQPTKVITLIPDPSKETSEFFFYEENYKQGLQLSDYIQKFSSLPKNSL
jgi:hypothetical protein